MQTKPYDLQEAPQNRASGCSRVIFFLFCVILPVGALVTELSTHMCAGSFFDPIPRSLNVLLIALVPLGNFVVWRSLSQGELKHTERLYLLSGLTLGTTLYYTLLFLPLSIMGVMVIIYGGLGLLPLAPACAFLGAFTCYRLLKKRSAGQSTRNLWLGLCLSLALLLMAELPSSLTAYHMRGAATGDADSISVLRNWGDRDFVLNSCYLRASNKLLLFGTILNGRGSFVDSAQSRQIYYRMTGVPFNAVPPPDFLRGSLTRWDFDPERGSEQVGGRIKDLYLELSSILCSVEPESCLSYTEWTFVFRNDDLQGAQEARMQLLLPPGGVVSRATLWVNGKEKEAAFASRAKAREAYESVVSRSQDPLLVTTCGPDRALVQCFPVPVGGGKMRIRIGITAPLQLNSLTEGVLPLAKMIERNFTFEGEHELRVVSTTPIGGSLALSNKTADVADLKLMETASHLKVARPESTESVYAVGNDGSSVVGHITETASELSPSALFVVDGSASAKTSALEIAEVLPPEAKVIFTGDRVKEIMAAELGEEDFLGGQDAEPALEKALELADSDGAIIWFHTAQPVELQFGDRLSDLMKKRKDVRLYSFPLSHGPNRVLEKMDGMTQVVSVLRQGTVAEDLARLLKTPKSWTIELERTDDPSGVEGSSHLARLWAAQQSERLWASGSEEEAAKLAIKHQLVTPASGAVVLETQEQYDANDLQPVDAGTVPTIPEPEIWLLLLVAFLAVLVSKRWRFAW